MASRRNYSDSDMARMQQEAMERVREMQSRANAAGSDGERPAYTPPPNYNGRNFRNWNANPNTFRQNNRGNRQRLEQRPPPPPEPPPEPEPPAPPVEPEPPETPAAEQKKDTTLIQDILGAVGLDDDRLLIIGLLFILINAKADTTLILSLIYLLI